MALTQMSIYTDLHVYRPVQKNKPKINHQKITHAKLMHHPTRDLESLYTCVHASSLHRIDSLLHCICLLSKEVQIVLTGIKLSNQYLLKTEKVLNY